MQILIIHFNQVKSYYLQIIPHNLQRIYSTSTLLITLQSLVYLPKQPVIREFVKSQQKSKPQRLHIYQQTKQNYNVSYYIHTQKPSLINKLQSLSTRVER
ncbi:unnamed protein product [Paramecium octaurelia]|uniref:Uncharacterized protein n=1 Tax=Paramecium octaurelia TaxID=43137 RepID=A0A8S1T0C0_PAROT|nr:unnamed protein product [Paramecium octaurelia]